MEKAKPVKPKDEPFCFLCCSVSLLHLFLLLLASLSAFVFAFASSSPSSSSWSAVAWAAGLLFAWTAMEIAFKPWLDAGRSAIRKSLDPNYDVDDELDQAPLPSSSSSQQQQQQETDRIHDSAGDGDDDKDAVDSHQKAS